MSDPLIFLGQITKIHGIKGEVFVATSGEYLSFLQERNPVHFYKDTEVSGGIITSSKPAGEMRLFSRPRKVLNGYLLQFMDIADRTAAEKFKNLVLGVNRSEFLSRIKNPEEYLVSYVGLDIIDYTSGKTVGSVTGVEENGKNIWLTGKLITDPKQEILIPLNGDIISETNYEKNYLKVLEYESFIT